MNAKAVKRNQHLLNYDNGKRMGLLLNWGWSTGVDHLEWNAAHTRTQLTGEQELMKAIIEDAIHILTSNKIGSERVVWEIIEWMKEKGAGYVFSFDNCCEALGLNPEYTRKTFLEEQKPKTTP